MNESARKYKINAYLLSLTVGEYRMALRIIPKFIGISLNTFHNYRNIKLGEQQDIPYERVVRLEQLFEMEPGTLINHEVRCVSFKELLRMNKGVATRKKMC